MKTIKFNLILDDKPIRNIEQLQENFSVEDILKTYKNGLLKRWLRVRGYNEYLYKIEQLNESNDKNIIKYLINIFEIYVDEDELEQIMNTVDYINAKDDKDYTAMDLYSYEFNVEQYHKGYENLIASISQNKDNVGKLKAIFEEIDEKYINLFKMNYKYVYNNFDTDSISSLFIIFSIEKLKNILMKDEDIMKDIMKDLNKIIQKNILKNNDSYLNYNNQITYTDEDIDKIKMKYKDKVRRAIGDTQGLTKLVTKEKVIILGIKNTGFGLFNGRNLNFLYDFSMKEKYPKYEAIGRVLNGLYIENAEASFPAEIEYILYSDVYSKENDSQTLTIDKNIKIYSNKTEGYWKEIENINKKIMIIDIDQNSMVKSIKEDKILQGKDIKGKFIILNGLEYNSDSNKPLIYMEV